MTTPTSPTAQPPLGDGGQGTTDDGSLASTTDRTAGENGATGSRSAGPNASSAAVQQTTAARQAAPGSAAIATPLERLGELLDRLLVLDVFLVIGAALWFALAVLLQSRGIEAPLRLFQALWQPLFTPAIGLLMAAALLSGALGWWRRRGQR